jgi:hypothetical protein
MIKTESVKFLEVVRDSNGQIIQVNDALANLNDPITGESKACQFCARPIPLDATFKTCFICWADSYCGAGS